MKLLKQILKTLKSYKSNASLNIMFLMNFYGIQILKEKHKFINIC